MVVTFLSGSLIGSGRQELENEALARFGWSRYRRGHWRAWLQQSPWMLSEKSGDAVVSPSNSIILVPCHHCWSIRCDSNTLSEAKYHLDCAHAYVGKW